MLFGTLFLLTCVSGELRAGTDSLPVELFAEGNWTSCRAECIRLLVQKPANQPILLLKSICDLRLGFDGTNSLSAIAAATNNPAETRAMAAFELGRAQWRHGDISNAFTNLRNAFSLAESPGLFARAGCSLDLLIGENKAVLRESAEAIETQLASCAATWPRTLWNECDIAPADQHASLTGKPGQWLIQFYRSQISPALGQRCSLVPSCSEYGRQALAKHGLLGMAITGDRMVRESDVVAAKEAVVEIDGHRYYADPVSKHDWWLETGGPK